MGSKPNWGGALSNLGQALYGYGMRKDRQKFAEKERRQREEAMMKLREFTSGEIDRRSKENFERQQAAWLDRLNETDPYFLAEGAALPDGTPMLGAGMRLSEVANRTRLADAMKPEAPPSPDGLMWDFGNGNAAELPPSEYAKMYRHMNPQEGGGTNRMTVTDENGIPYEVTPNQAYNINNPKPSALEDYLIKTDMRNEQRAAEAEQKQIMDMATFTERSMFDDILGKTGVVTRMINDGWEYQDDSRTTLERDTNGILPGGKETKTYAEIAAERVAPLIADGEVDDIDYNAIKKLALDLGVTAADIMAEWPQELVNMYLSFEKNPLSDDQKKAIEDLENEGG